MSGKGFEKSVIRFRAKKVYNKSSPSRLVLRDLIYHRVFPTKIGGQLINTVLFSILEMFDDFRDTESLIFLTRNPAQSQLKAKKESNQLTLFRN